MSNGRCRMKCCFLFSLTNGLDYIPVCLLLQEGIKTGWRWWQHGCFLSSTSLSTWLQFLYLFSRSEEDGFYYFSLVLHEKHWFCKLVRVLMQLVEFDPWAIIMIKWTNVELYVIVRVISPERVLKLLLVYWVIWEYGIRV